MGARSWALTTGFLAGWVGGCTSSFGAPPPEPEASAAAPRAAPERAPGSTVAVAPEPVQVPFDLPTFATLPLAPYRSGDCVLLGPQPSVDAGPLVTDQGVFLATLDGVERFDGERWHRDPIRNDEDAPPTELTIRLGPGGFPLVQAEFGGPADRRLYLFDGRGWNELDLDGGFPWWVFAVGDALMMERRVGLFRQEAGAWKAVADWPWPRWSRVWSPGVDEHFLAELDAGTTVQVSRWTPAAGFVELERVPRERIALRQDPFGQENLLLHAHTVWRFGREGLAVEPLPAGVDATTCVRRFPAPSVFELDCDGSVVRVDSDAGRLVVDERPAPPGDGRVHYGFDASGGLAAMVSSGRSRRVLSHRDDGAWEAFPSQTLPELTTALAGTDVDLLFVGTDDGVYRVFVDGLALVPATDGWNVSDLVVAGSGAVTVAVEVAGDGAADLATCADERRATPVAPGCPHVAIWRGHPGDRLVRELAVTGGGCGPRCAVARERDEVAVVRPPWVHLRDGSRWRTLRPSDFGHPLATVTGLAWAPRPAPLLVAGRSCEGCGFSGALDAETVSAFELHRAAQLGFAGHEVSLAQPAGEPGTVESRAEGVSRLGEGLAGRVAGAHEDGRLVYLDANHTAWLEATREAATLDAITETAAAAWRSDYVSDAGPLLTDGERLAGATWNGPVLCDLE